MRCSQVRAKHNHSSSEHDISRRQRIGQVQDLGLHDIAAIGKRVIHRRIVTNMLIACKIEINYSKHNSSIVEFAAINERREVASINGVSHRATVRPDERKLDG